MLRWPMSGIALEPQTSPRLQQLPPQRLARPCPRTYLPALRLPRTRPAASESAWACPASRAGASQVHNPWPALGSSSHPAGRLTSPSPAAITRALAPSHPPALRYSKLLPQQTCSSEERGNIQYIYSAQQDLWSNLAVLKQHECLMSVRILTRIKSFHCSDKSSLEIMLLVSKSFAGPNHIPPFCFATSNWGEEGCSDIETPCRICLGQ